MNTIERITTVTATLPDLIAKVDAELSDLKERMSQLKKAGLIYASPHMKDGKYLVLLYPSDASSKRVREYIGKDPDKMQIAHDSIKRAKDYDELGRQAARLEAVTVAALREIQEAARILFSRKLNN